MSLIRTLFLFSLCMLFWACPEDDAPIDGATVSVNFRATFGNEELKIFSDRYDYADQESRLLISLFQFYMSDLQLVPTDGSEPITLSEIELVRWNSSTDPSELSFSYTDVPDGSYNIQFGLGVKPELNNTNPNEFPADFVLNENEFWSEVTRYVFAKIEGNAELEDDDLFDTPLSYHIGKNDFYTTLQWLGADAAIEVSNELDNEIDFTVDIQRMMAESGSAFTDFRDEANRIVHNPNSPISAQQWSNLQQAIVLIR